MDFHPIWIVRFKVITPYEIGIDITPMCWRYVPSYLDRQDKERMMPGREKLRKEYGIELKDFISEKHDK